MADLERTDYELFAGVWSLAGSGTLYVGIGDLDVESEPSDQEFAERAEQWLSGADGQPYFEPATGLTVQVEADGTFTDFGEAEVELMSVPGRGRLVSFEGRTVAVNLDERAPLPYRIDADGTQMVETWAVDSDGDLVRVQHLVLDGIYLSRPGLVYRRVQVIRPDFG